MGTEDAAVAIITRTRNRPVTLDRAIEDVLRQSFSDWQLIVVDDGGDLPSTTRVIERHSRSLGGRAKLLPRERRRGKEAASNFGIANSASRYIVVHDDDDTWHPDFLARGVSRLEASPSSVGGVISGAQQIFERFDDDRLVEIGRRAFPLPNCPVSMATLTQRNLFPPISFLFRRSALDRVGSFREDLPALGDWDFNLRFARQFKIGVIPDVLAFWHIRHRARGARGSYANSPYFDHLAALMRLRREWGQARPYWRYLLFWRY